MSDSTPLKPITAEELMLWDALVKAATEGPWAQFNASAWHGGIQEITEVFVMRPDDDVAICPDVTNPKTGTPDKVTAQFIAASREAMPRLIARVLELEAYIKATSGKDWAE